MKDEKELNKMVVYAVVNYFGHEGGDYDEMNGSYSTCIGIFSSPELAIDAVKKIVQYRITESAKYGKEVVYVEDDPSLHGNNVIYYAKRIDCPEVDWYDYFVRSCNLDEYDVTGVLF